MAIGDTGTFTDTKDGKSYTWKILKDGKKWMTQNYNYESANSVCYDNKATNGQQYGRMYDGNEAKNFIPDGWRIPKQEDYHDLYNYYSVKDFTIDGDSGLNLMFGGLCYKQNGQFNFGEKGVFGSYWTHYFDGNQMGGKPAAWDNKVYKCEMRNGYDYSTQGAFLVLTESKCYVRYIKDI